MCHSVFDHSYRCSARASSRRNHFALIHVRPHALQRITPYQQTIAQKAAAYFAKNDSDDAKLRFFEMANPNFKTKHTAAKMFYALLGMTRYVVLRLRHLVAAARCECSRAPCALRGLERTACDMCVWLTCVCDRAVLLNESIVTLTQEAPYGNIDVTPTPNTLNYNL